MSKTKVLAFDLGTRTATYFTANMEAKLVELYEEKL